MAVMRRGDSLYIYFKPFKDKKIGVKVEVSGKREAEQIEGAILRACRTGSYAGLDPLARETCVRLFLNQRWELPEDLGCPAPKPRQELGLWEATRMCLTYPAVGDSQNRDRHETSFAHVVKYFGKTYPIKRMWVPQIRQYMAARQAAGAAPSTVNKEKAALSKLFQVLVELQHVDVNPARLVRSLSEKSGERQVYISLKDFGRILAVLPDWFQPVAQTAFYTGMRRGEILGLTWRRVDLKNRMIFLGPENTKEGNWKRVPIHRELVPIMEILRNDQVVGLGAVFLHDGVPLTHKNQVRWAWDQTVVEPVLNPAPRFHDLRHTWRTNARRSGVDPQIAETIMGHWTKGRSVTDRYGYISDEELLDAIDKMTFDHGDTRVWVARQKEKGGDPKAGRKAKGLDTRKPLGKLRQKEKGNKKETRTRLVSAGSK